MSSDRTGPTIADEAWPEDPADKLRRSLEALNPGDWGYDECESALAEIEQLRAEIEDWRVEAQAQADEVKRLRIWSSDSHVTELEATIEQVRALGFAIVNAHADEEAMAAENAWIEYWEDR